MVHDGCRLVPKREANIPRAAAGSWVLARCQLPAARHTTQTLQRQDSRSPHPSRHYKYLHYQSAPVTSTAMPCVLAPANTLYPLLAAQGTRGPERARTWQCTSTAAGSWEHSRRVMILASRVLCQRQGMRQTPPPSLSVHIVNQRRKARARGPHWGPCALAPKPCTAWASGCIRHRRSQAYTYTYTYATGGPPHHPYSLHDKQHGPSHAPACRLPPHLLPPYRYAPPPDSVAWLSPHMAAFATGAIPQCPVPSHMFQLTLASLPSPSSAIVRMRGCNNQP